MDKGSPDRLNLISSHRLARSTFWSLLGTIGPVLIGLFAIPILVKGLGLDRFGILTMVWVLIGYFGLFDFGLGRSLTKHVSDLLGEGRTEDIPKLVGTGLNILVLLGIMASVFLWFFAPLLVERVLLIPDDLRPETLSAIRWLVISLPFVIATTGLMGVLQAHQNFKPIGIVRTFLGAFMFLIPVSILPFSSSLALITGILASGRILACAALFYSCSKIVPGIWHGCRSSNFMTRELLSFGGWLTISNIVSPIMVYFDRFFVGAIVGMQAVAFYSTPHDLLRRIRVLTSSFMEVLFPAMATANKLEEKNIIRIVKTSFLCLELTIIPALIVLILLAPELLQIWLGPEFARQSAPAAQILGIGVFINTFAQIPRTLIQGSGRADWTAKLHLIELPLFLISLWWFVHHWGIIGAAFVWLIRVTIDTWALFLLAGKLHLSLQVVLKRILSRAITVSVLMFLILKWFAIYPWIRLGFALLVAFIAVTLIGKHGRLLMSTWWPNVE